MRYLIPILFFVILLAAAVLVKWQFKYEKILIALIILLGLFYQINLLVNFHFKPVVIALAQPDSQKRIPALGFSLYLPGYYTTGLPIKEDWKAQNIVTQIKSNHSNTDNIKVVLLGSQHWRFNFFTLAYFGQMQAPYLELMDSVNALPEADFAVVRYDGQDNPYQINGEEMSHYTLPDGSQVELYDLRK